MNNDKDIGDLLKVVFIEDYNVSKAEIIVPASDISEHISTAGTEASGTSNMKFVLNGGMIIGTCDGANIEIGREIGEDNIFLFGSLSEDVEELRHRQRFEKPELDPKLKEVVDAIEGGQFGDPDIYEGLVSSLKDGNDYYLVSNDFASYLGAQDLVDESFKNKDEWATKSIHSVASMGFFSSDRCINEYVPIPPSLSCKHEY